MPRAFNLDGKAYSFPDNTTDEEALQFLETNAAPPPMADVVAAAPGAAKRQIISGVAGAHQVVGDVFNLPGVQETAHYAKKGIAEEAALETPKNMTTLQEGVLSGVSSALAQVPAVAVSGPLGLARSVATGAAAAGSRLAFGAGTSIMGAQTGFQRYGDLRDAGFAPARAALHGVFEGLVEKYTEYLPLRDLTTGLKSHLVSFLWKDMTGEQIATLLQDMSAKLSDQPDMTLGDYVKDALVTAIATPVSAGLQLGTVAAARSMLPAPAPTVAGTPVGAPASLFPAEPTTPPIGTVNPPTAMPATVGLAEPAGVSEPGLASWGVLPLPLPLAPTAPQNQESQGQTTQVQTSSPVGLPGSAQPSNVNTGLAEGSAPVMKTTEVQAPSGRLRVYSTKVDGKYVLVAEDKASLPPSDQPVLYADVLQDELKALTRNVPETARLEADAPTVHVIPNSSSLSWHALSEEPGVAPAVAPVRPITAQPAPETTTLVGAPTAEIAFPGASEKALWRLGTALLRADTQQGFVSSKILKNLTEKVQKALSLPSPALATSAANQYVRGALALGVYETAQKTAKISAPTVADATTAVTRQKEALAKTKVGLIPGKVRVAEGLEQTQWVKRMSAYLQAWITTFSPRMSVVIRDVADPAKGVNSSTMFVEGVHYVTIPAQTRIGVDGKVQQTIALLSLAHEFGHMLISQHVNDPTLTKQRDALLREYTRQVAEAQNMTTEQFVEASRSPQDLLEAQIGGGKLFGVEMTAPYGALSLRMAQREGHDYIGSFDEWAAEQFVRYANENRSVFLEPSLKGFWEPLMKKMSEFWSKVVHRFAPSKAYAKWLNELTSLSAEQSAVATESAPIVHKSVTNEPSDQYRYTTKVLDRLPNKPLIKKVTIYGEIGRADVRKQETELIGRIIKTFPGDSVDSALFRERVLGEIIPLHLAINRDSDYVDYGMTSIGLDPNVSANTAVHIWQNPGSAYVSPHFPQDADYWAHTRVATEILTRAAVPTATMPHQFSPYTNVRRTIVEVQSDLEQRGIATPQPIAPEELARREEELRLVSTIANRVAQGNRAEADKLAQELAAQNTPDSDFVWDLMAVGRPQVEWTDTVRQDIVDRLVEHEQQLTLVLAENQKALQEVKRESVLPKKWWELVLLHENALAAKDGITTMRIVGPESLWRVEGWPIRRFYPGLAGVRIGPEAAGTNPLQRMDISRATNAIATGELEGNQVQYTYGDPGRRMVTSITVDQPTLLMLTKGLAFEERPPERAQPIMNRYVKEILPFVKREFGAKEVVVGLAIQGRDNADFLEWQVDPLMASMPIRYYSLTQALNEGSPPIEKAGTVPELPRYIGYISNLLQLNQVAKLLPQVQGLQTYRRTMQSLHALKAKMFSGPNDRIHQWHSIGYKQALKVEGALREEQQQGEHWTLLTQVPIAEGSQKLVWVHQPTAGFEKLMDQRGISREGRDVFLGVKNDYLSTLQMMEDVVAKNLNEFFTNNPDALAQRLAASKAEFEKLRQTPYLPDMRFGKWSVQVFAGHAETVDGRDIKKGELVYWEKFDRKWQRDRKFTELRRQYGAEHTVAHSFDDDTVAPMRGLPQSLVDVMKETLNSDPDTKLTEAQMSAINDMAFDQTAAGKFAKYLGTAKKNIGGASKDVQRAYAAYHWKTANAVAKLYYYRQLQQAMNSVKGEATALRQQGQGSDEYDKLLGYLRRNFTYVMQPQGEWEQLRSLVSLWYLWGSAKTAVMNLMSVPVLTFPYLWSRYGMLQSQASMLRAMKDVATYWKNPEKLSVDRQRVLAKLKEDGVTDQSFAAMLASVADGGVAFERMIPKFELLGGEFSYAARMGIWKATSLGMLPFRVIEQFNRQVTGLAAYDLESKRLGKTLSAGDLEAYTFARDSVDYTQNEYGPWNRPPLAQGKQSIALLFFSFVQNMSFMMFGGDKSWWRALMVLGVLAGIQGLPGVDNLIDIMNWTMRKLTGDYVDLRVEARELAQAVGANPDMVMHGVSHSWGIGWDTSGSVGQGRVVPGTDAIFGIGKFEDRFLHAAGEIGGPVGSLAISFLQAMADDNPSALLSWDKMLPPVLRNLERSIVASQLEAFTNARGRPLAADPTALELVGQSLGFAPTRKTQEQELLHTAKDAAVFYQLRRQNLMEMMYVARKTHDPDTVAEVRSRINEFNNTVPSHGLRINGEDISRSMAARVKMDKETELGRSPSKRYQDLYLQVGNVF